jgi:hypothetical protein
VKPRRPLENENPIFEVFTDMDCTTKFIKNRLQFLAKFLNDDWVPKIKIKSPLSDNCQLGYLYFN